MDTKYEILNYLQTKTAPVKSKVLQDAFDVSRRTIINYIKQLNNESPELILSTSYGYEITNRKAAIELLNIASNQFTFVGYDKRKMYILEKLLLCQEKVTTFNLSELLFTAD